MDYRAEIVKHYGITDTDEFDRCIVEAYENGSVGGKERHVFKIWYENLESLAKSMPKGCKEPYKFDIKRVWRVLESDGRLRFDDMKDRSVRKPNHPSELIGCKCENLIITKRISSNNRPFYVWECVNCGWPDSTNMVSKIMALEAYSGNEPPDSNTELWEKTQQKAMEIRKSKKNEKLERKKEYNTYLASPEWQKKREKVFARARNICEGCLEAEAEVVHHTTYAHIFNEFMFELVALCKDCHTRYHEKEK